MSRWEEMGAGSPNPLCPQPRELRSLVLQTARPGPGPRGAASRRSPGAPPWRSGALGCRARRASSRPAETGWSGLPAAPPPPPGAAGLRAGGRPERRGPALAPPCRVLPEPQGPPAPRGIRGSGAQGQRGGRRGHSGAGEADDWLEGDAIAGSAPPPRLSHQRPCNPSHGAT